MRLLSRYIFRQFFSPFFLSIFAFSVIILVIQVFQDLHNLMEQKPSFGVTVEYYFLRIPGLLLEITPIAVLMAVLFSLGNLGKQSELIAMRAGGASIFMVARPLLLCGVIIFAATILFDEWVVPKANHLEDQIYWNQIERQPKTHPTTKSNISLMSADNQLVHIGNFDGNTGTLTDVMIMSFGSGIQLRSRLDAKSAVFEKGQWVFKTGFFRAFDDTGAEISCRAFNESPFPFLQKPEDFLKDDTQPEQLNILQLYSTIQQLKQSGSDSHLESVEFHKKIALPFACVILAVLGVPWGWSLGKYSGVASSFGICMLVAFIYIGGMQIFQTLGTSGTLSPFASMWTANILFGLGSVWMLVRRNR